MNIYTARKSTTSRGVSWSIIRRVNECTEELVKGPYNSARNAFLSYLLFISDTDTE